MHHCVARLLALAASVPRALEGVEPQSTEILVLQLCGAYWNLVGIRDSPG